MAKLICIVLLVGAIAAVAGCGSGVGTPSPNTFGAVVNDCNSGALFYSNAELATLIDVVESDQRQGASYDQQLSAALDSCSAGWGAGSEEAGDCVVCGRAALNYVYGR